ncbi:hypothetical protein PLESTM_000005300 [Pleodorina starrii]|nr:hypothetical protein PLESTM_000005300 [Pleodorina starrii]
MTTLLRNYVYCPGSLLDQAITCLETTTEGSCSANAACVWTDRFFGVWDKATGTNDASRIMMSAVDSAISESVGWLKGPHDTVLADKYYSDSVVMPFKYCAARWTINETALVSLYDGFSGWQKVALPDDTTMLRSAAALLGTAGQAITGTCAAGKQFTDWASVCTNAGSKETCPGSLNSVSCQWDPTFGVCKPYILSAGDSIRDRYSYNQWMQLLNSQMITCNSTANNAAACAAEGATFTYDTATLESFSTLRTSWYYSDPPLPPPPSPPSPTSSPAPSSPPSTAPPSPPPRPLLPRPPSPSPRSSGSSASALRLGWAAVLLQAVMFALAALTGHHH